MFLELFDNLSKYMPYKDELRRTPPCFIPLIINKLSNLTLRQLSFSLIEVKQLFNYFLHQKYFTIKILNSIYNPNKNNLILLLLHQKKLNNMLNFNL